MAIVVRQPDDPVNSALPGTVGGELIANAGMVRSARLGTLGQPVGARGTGSAEPVFEIGHRTWEAIGQRPRGTSSSGRKRGVAVESTKEAVCQRLGPEVRPE